MADLTCTNGKVAISDMVTAINDRLETDDYANETTGGVIKVRIDETDPSNIKLYMTNDGTNP